MDLILGSNKDRTSTPLSSRDRQSGSGREHQRHNSGASNSSRAGTPVSSKDKHHTSSGSRTGTPTSSKDHRSKLSKDLIDKNKMKDGRHGSNSSQSGLTEDSKKEPHRKRTRQAIQSPATNTPDHATSAKRVRRN